MSSNSTDKRDIRRFGLIALLFFGILCGLGIWRERMLATWFFGGLAFLGLVFFCLPRQSAPLYRAWLAVAHLIGRGVTLVVLTLAFYLVITPTALIKRLLGGTPLATRPDKNAASYWVTRTEPVQPKERFHKRY